MKRYLIWIPLIGIVLAYIFGLKYIRELSAETYYIALMASALEWAVVGGIWLDYIFSLFQL